MMNRHQAANNTSTPRALAPAPALGSLRAGALIDASTLPALIAYQMRGALRVRQVVAAYYDLSVASLLAPGRAQEVAEARQVAMYLMRQGLYWPTLKRVMTAEHGAVTVLTKRPFPWQQIARLVGRDHSTVMHGWQVIAHKRATRPQVASLVAELIGILRVPARDETAAAA